MHRQRTSRNESGNWNLIHAHCRINNIWKKNNTNRDSCESVCKLEPKFTWTSTNSITDYTWPDPRTKRFLLTSHSLILRIQLDFIFKKNTKEMDWFCKNKKMNHFIHVVFFFAKRPSGTNLTVDFLFRFRTYGFSCIYLFLPNNHPDVLCYLRVLRLKSTWTTQ